MEQPPMIMVKFACLSMCQIELRESRKLIRRRKLLLEFICHLYLFPFIGFSHPVHGISYTTKVNSPNHRFLSLSPSDIFSLESHLILW